MSSLTPVLTFTDATRSGPVGASRTSIELALDSGAFTNIAWRPGPLAEQPGQTSLTSPQGLPAAAQFFWHVRATAGPTTTGPWSATQEFLNGTARRTRRPVGRLHPMACSSITRGPATSNSS